MKKLLVPLIMLLFGANASAQFVRQSLGGSPTTLSFVKGSIKGDSGLVFISYPDTATANLGPNMKKTDGLAIKVHDTIFVRDSLQSKWLRMVSTGSNTPVIFAPGVDSIKIIGDQVCQYIGGGPAICYYLPSTPPDTVIYKYPLHVIKKETTGADHDSVEIISSGSGTVVETVFRWSVNDSISTPPVSPANGDVYLVGTSATGAWVGHNNQIATYHSSGTPWTYGVAITGDLLNNAATGIVSKWTGAVWLRVGKPALHQGGDSYTAPIVVGSTDHQDVSIIQDNVVRARIDKVNKSMFMTDGTNIIFPANYGVGWGDMNNGILGDGSAYMRFDTYVGRWKWRNSQFNTTLMTLENEVMYVNPAMLIGGIETKDPAAGLEVRFTDKGLLMPRVTNTQMQAIGGGWRAGTKTASGSGYTPGVYNYQDFTGGTGTAFQAHITVGVGGTITVVQPVSEGRGYHVGDLLTSTGMGPGTGFQYRIDSLSIRGLQVYNLDSNYTFLHNGKAWVGFAPSAVADLSGFVHFAGAETITGKKTFTDTLIIGDKGIKVQSTDNAIVHLITTTSGSSTFPWIDISASSSGSKLRMAANNSGTAADMLRIVADYTDSIVSGTFRPLEIKAYGPLTLTGNYGGGDGDPRIVFTASTSPTDTAAKFNSAGRFVSLKGVNIIDGTQGAGKVFTSDANGAGTWQTPSGGSDASKLNISDTLTMLSGYQTAINARVKYTDTATMLSGYRTAINTNTTNIAAKLTGTYPNTTNKYINGYGAFTTMVVDSISNAARTNGTNSFSGIQTVSIPSIGAGATSDGMVLANPTAAALAAQQNSPVLHLQGFGWGTTAGTSQSVDFKVVNAITQSTVPIGVLTISSSVAGSAYTNRLSIQSNNQVIAPGQIFAATGFFANMSGIAATTVDGIAVTNSTAATSGVPVQNSPRSRWSGNGWTGAASQQADWIATTIPVSGTSPITSRWELGSQINGGGFTTRFSITDAGNAIVNSTLGVGVTSNVASAIFQTDATNKGFLAPRMTKTQRDAIASPATGLIIWQTDNTPGLRSFNGTNWVRYTETID